MSVFVIIHTKVDDIENHHREIAPKIMEAVKRHGGRRIAGPRRALSSPRGRTAERRPRGHP